MVWKTAIRDRRLSRETGIEQDLAGKEVRAVLRKP